MSLVWPERYNTYKNVQGAQLELHESTSLQALCRPDRYLWLAGSEHLMRICSAQTSDHRLVVSARDAAYILDERSSLQTLKNFSATEATVEAGNSFNVMKYISSITDDKDTEDTLSRRIIVNGTYSTSKSGTYTLDVYCTDSDLNESNHVAFTLNVK